MSKCKYSNICTAQSAVSTIRAFLYRVLAYAHPLLIRSFLGCWRSSCSPALKGRTRTQNRSRFDVRGHAAASFSSLFSRSHRLSSILPDPGHGGTQAHSHVLGAPLEQQRIGITGTGRQRVAHGAARMVHPHVLAAA